MSDWQAGDLLDMAYINGLPQPFIMRQYGEKSFDWQVEDIDVQTGLVRFDVCGKLQVTHIGNIAAFRDMDGVEHDPDDFYCEAERRISIPHIMPVEA